MLWIEIPSLIVALLTLGALAFKGVRAAVHVTDAIPVLLDAAKELRNNGGTSVKDNVQHIKRVQAVLAQDIADHVKEDREHFAKIDAKLETLT